MKPVVVQIEINCAPEIAWEYMVNAEHNPEWLPNMRSCTWIIDPPIRDGSRYEQVARFLGRDVRISFEVTAFDDGRPPLVRRNIARAYRNLKQLLETAVETA